MSGHCKRVNICASIDVFHSTHTRKVCIGCWTPQDPVSRIHWRMNISITRTQRDSGLNVPLRGIPSDDHRLIKCQEQSYEGVWLVNPRCVGPLRTLLPSVLGGCDKLRTYPGWRRRNFCRGRLPPRGGRASVRASENRGDHPNC